MEFVLLNREKAKRIYEANHENIDHLYSLLSDEYLEMRAYLVRSYESIKSDMSEKPSKKNRKDKYNLDLEFGLKIYSYLNDLMNIGLNFRYLSDEKFWIYISVYVIPDIVRDRWEGGKIEDHMYALPRRIWIFSLWWYIYLSLQTKSADGSSLYEMNKKELAEVLYNTEAILSDNNTDTILNLVERSGKGYDVRVCREIMKQYDSIRWLENSKNNRNIFRSIMIHNTSFSETIIPEYYENGVEGYVNMLVNKSTADIETSM